MEQNSQTFSSTLVTQIQQSSPSQTALTSENGIKSVLQGFLEEGRAKEKELQWYW